MKLSLSAILVITIGLLSEVHAQAPVTPLTNAELHAKVAALQQEMSGLRSDYQVLLTACAIPPSASSDTASADQLTRATSAIQQVRIDADNRLEQQRQEQRLDEASWVVKSINFSVTEANKVFMRYAWKVTIKNGISRTQGFDLVVQFLDTGGFVIDTDRLYGQTIAAFDERTLAGDALVRMPGALRVAKVQAVATRKR